MPANYLFTSESVSEGHPDKMSTVSDAILDAHLTRNQTPGLHAKHCEDKPRHRRRKIFLGYRHYPPDPTRGQRWCDHSARALTETPAVSPSATEP